MMPLRFPILPLLLVCCLGGLSACVNFPLPQQGFLQNYSALRPAQDGSGALVYIKAPGILKQYDKVMLDPVVIWYSPQAEYRGIHPDELKAIADYFRNSAIAVLEGRYPVVDEAGPGVLRIRAAITGIVPRAPNSVPPPQVATVWVVDGLGALTGTEVVIPDNGRFGQTVSLAQASVEAELLDSVSGERLGAFIDRRSADEAFIDPLATPGEQVKLVLDYWVGKLRYRLDKTRQAGNSQRIRLYRRPTVEIASR